jgi:hypothetical protein
VTIDVDESRWGAVVCGGWLGAVVFSTWEFESEAASGEFEAFTTAAVRMFSEGLIRN